MAEEQVTRIMPNSIEAEKSVIGAMIMDKEAIDIAQNILTADDFFNAPYGLYFDALIELNEEGSGIDIVILQDKLKQKNTPPQFVEAGFIAGLLDSTAVSVNIKNHAKIVREKSQLRQIIKASQLIEKDCFAQDQDASVIIDVSQQSFKELAEMQDGTTTRSIGEIVQNALTNIEKASRQTGAITGIPTGFIDLDYKTAGMQPSDLILLAARPSMGKTALALNIAQYAAFHENKAVAIFSLEMSSEQLVNRMFSLESKVDAQKLRTGNLQDSEWEQLVEGASTIAQSKLIIDDTQPMNITEMRAKCRKYQQSSTGLDMIIIDYLQLMNGTGKDVSRQQEISDISRALKGLARELKVPVIALSQLNRGVEQRDDKRPMLSDLRDSGAIEQDADVVMFIYRDDYYNKDTEKKGISEVIIAKQRNGPVGTVELVWLPEYTKFANKIKDKKEFKEN
ncbi:MAG: replicative DNA helicase [Lachnospiraceae bacterium]|nr:replicative DNA helicase [Lachnospiraceae bacterium]